MYIALKYVCVGNKMYTPGEVFDDDPNAGFHLKIKAIKEFSDTEKTDVAISPEEEPEKNETPVYDEPEEEPEYIEPSAPEIDVMDAVVSKPAKKGKSKKGGDSK